MAPGAQLSSGMSIDVPPGRSLVVACPLTWHRKRSFYAIALILIVQDCPMVPPMDGTSYRHLVAQWCHFLYFAKYRPVLSCAKAIPTLSCLRIFRFI